MAKSMLSSPFLSGKNRVADHMRLLLLALIPALIAQTYFFGYGILINIVITVSIALITEAVMLKLRQRPIKPFLFDGSAIVTATLLAMAIPPLSPWWLSAIGISFAIIFAKHLYGGLGYNPFNPAMIAYVLLLVSFPLEMTQWLPVNSYQANGLDLTATWTAITTGQLPQMLSIDAISAATPLDYMKTQIGLAQHPTEIGQHGAFGLLAGQGWEWVNIAFAFGGLFLLYRNIISWHIPTAMLVSLGSISLITWLLSPETAASPWFHLFSGATMMGAFFIATDPVSGSTTPLGRLVFGAGVGLLTYIIRVWGGYPDGVAFAVIMMNMLVPLIDYYTQPKIYGATRK